MTITKSRALRTAERVADDRCDVTHHPQPAWRGHRAIRLSGAQLRDIEVVGRELSHALPNGKYVQDGGVALVWYGGRDTRDDMDDALHLEDSAS